MVSMGHSRSVREPATFVGRRVRWAGPPQHGFISPAYRRALAAGDTRLPTAAERLELQPGDEGVITELVATAAGGGQYALQFDSGYEVEVVLPSDLVDMAAPQGT